jgi:WD40 repeat protein
MIQFSRGLNGYHQAEVASAVFSPDGSRLVTASTDNIAWIWDVRLDPGTPEQWSELAEQSPFVVEGSALTRRRPRGLEPRRTD